jgi:hypothetical protein
MKSMKVVLWDGRKVLLQRARDAALGVKWSPSGASGGAKLVFHCRQLAGRIAGNAGESDGQMLRGPTFDRARDAAKASVVDKFTTIGEL